MKCNLYVEGITWLCGDTTLFSLQALKNNNKYYYFTKEHRFFRDYFMYLDKANDSNNDLFTCAENT